MSWPPTRAAALQRLEAFIPRAGQRYRAERNYDFGPGRHVAVSGLSPYLRSRLLTEAEVLRRVLDAHGASAADKFIQEVCWRTYWKGWLEQHPGAWTRYEQALGDAFAELAGNDDLQLRYATAVGGETGIDAFDAWVAELEATGYLHNHARMWFASIWTFTLELPWVLGADHFLRHLLDGDQASNTLSWRWVAGLHTRGKTYLARPDNIRRYTRDRFHALQALAPRAEALKDEPVALEPLELPAPLPAETGSCAMLLSDEDLTLPVGLAPVALAGLLTASERSGLDVAPAVLDFARGALADALNRGAEQYGAATGEIHGADDLAGVVSWVLALDVDSVMVNHQPVGPARTLLDALTARLEANGVAVHRLVCDYDRQAWPAADRGFFKLKKRIPELLAQLRA